jgi:hypothetical protein
LLADVLEKKLTADQRRDSVRLIRNPSSLVVDQALVTR